MQFASTRNPEARVGFNAALSQGLAPDGGLYVPTEWPPLDPATVPADLGALSGTALALLAGFARGDVLEPALPAIAAEAFDFPAPLVPLGASGRLSVLELFHGPTAAFKDFGARFLAATLTRLRAGATRPLKILVATSGDTGGAVAAAFHRKPGIEVTVLFPKGQVSPTQERQLTCWGDNVQSLAVRGSFDDCQRMVKQAFLDPALKQRFELSSANSINLGRLLPQAVYYLASSLTVWRQHGERASYVIPSGNLGNATACIWARALGAPIERVLLAHNANRTVPDYLDTGTLRTRASVPTLASAMDVGNPSNLERLTALFPDAGSLRGAVSATSIDDAAIRARITADLASYGQVWCPHTATAAEAYARLPADERGRGRWLLVATAHPAKFREIVEPLIGRELAVPVNLARLFERPVQCTEIDASLGALQAVL
ncbi:MAG TPA: threonine synthase [Steroidobacteraceae bacterium]|nr:threonine synthase [Steroidobacteraceae bacterium]